jgi:hypothetical protein
MNEYSQLPATFKLASYELQDFGRRKKLMLYGNPRSRYRGSLPYRTTRSAASVLDKLDGGEVVDHDDARELVDPLRRIARWNAVKCSPFNEQRSKPFREMWTNCPEMLLADEMRIAKPKVILTFGVDVFAAVERMAGFDSVPHRDGPLRRGTLLVDDHRVDVLGLHHPAALARRYWPESHAALIRLLRSPDYADSWEPAGRPSDAASRPGDPSPTGSQGWGCRTSDTQDRCANHSPSVSQLRVSDLDPTGDLVRALAQHPDHATDRFLADVSRSPTLQTFGQSRELTQQLRLRWE